jgi:1,4-dihydroxy-2-naphthoyl-CoA hydrolase
MDTPQESNRPTPAEALAAIQAADGGGLGARMGIEWLEVDPQRTVARMPVQGNTQPFGLLHGGASAVLAESVGSVGSNLHAGEGRFAVGIELSCSHHRSAREGYVTAVATPLSLGRSLATYAIEITDDEGRLVCTARLTCMLRSA